MAFGNTELSNLLQMFDQQGDGQKLPDLADAATLKIKDADTDMAIELLRPLLNGASERTAHNASLVLSRLGARKATQDQ